MRNWTKYCKSLLYQRFYGALKLCGTLMAHFLDLRLKRDESRQFIRYLGVRVRIEVTISS